jgi:hypothetical protein
VRVRAHVCNVRIRNGDEWYRLRAAVQQAMMRPTAVAQYLRQVDYVALDLCRYVRAKPTTTCKHDMFLMAGKWSLESECILKADTR